MTPLRLVMVLPSMRRAGAESVTATLCQTLATMPIEVHLLVVGHRCDYQESLQKQGVNLHFLNLFQGPIRFYRADIHHKIRRQLWQFFHEIKADIVHFHLFHSLLWGGYAARQSGAHTFYTAHGQDPWLGSHDLISRWRRFRFVRAMQRSQCRLLAVSSAVANHWIEGLGLDPNHDITIQANPLDAKLWLLPHKPASPHPPRVIMVGTLYPLKRVDMGLRALKIVAETLPEVEMWIVGDGPERSNLENLASQMQIVERVSFLGVRPDAAELLRSADVMWLLSEREGLPMVALEAMASALPLIGSDVPGIRELVKHEVNGLLAPLDQPQHVAISTMKLWQDTVLRSQVINGGLQCARQYDATSIAAQHLQHYRRALVE